MYLIVRQNFQQVHKSHILDFNHLFNSIHFNTIQINIKSKREKILKKTDIVNFNTIPH